MAKLWTADELRRARRMRIGGASVREVADALGRSYDAVQSRLAKDGWPAAQRQDRDDWTAEKDHLRCDYSGEDDPVACRPEPEWRGGQYPRRPAPEIFGGGSLA